jgi:hypothetical protein
MLTKEIEFTPGVSESSILSRVRSFAQGNSLYRQHGYVLDGDDRFFEKAALDSKYVAAMSHSSKMNSAFTYRIARSAQTIWALCARLRTLSPASSHSR